MSVIAKYTCNASGVVPTFNNGYVYEINETESNGVYTVEITSDTDFSSCSFNGKSQLLTVEYLKVTQNVTSMSQMFRGCTNLTSLDVSNFDTSNITNTYQTFSNCTNLTSLNLSSFNTSNVTSMNSMFYNCNKLTTLDVSSFDTSKVTTMFYMFYNCSSLTTIDVSNFNTSEVTNMQSMFHNCNNLVILDVSSFDTSNVTDMNNMFQNCTNLTSLDISSWDTSKVTNMNSMFMYSGLKTLDLSRWNINKLTMTRSMFQGSTNLTSLDVSNWDTSNITDMHTTFCECKSLKEIKGIENWNTSNVTNMYHMFGAISYMVMSFKSLDLSKWNTDKVVEMEGMFARCGNLESLDISNFNMKNASNKNMFLQNNKLNHIGMLYSNKETVEKIQAVLPNVNNLQRTIWVQDTDEKDYASNEYVIVKEYGFEKQKVRLPQPLRSIGNYKDKLYWDNEKGKYCIEQNVGVIELLDIVNDEGYKSFHTDDSIGYFGDDYNCLYCTEWSLYGSTENDIGLLSALSIISTIPSGNEKNPVNENIFIKWGSHDFRICIKKSLASTWEELIAYIENLDPVKIYYPIKPIIIETDITEKIGLNTYNPYMEISTNEKEMAPTNMVARFPYKDYFGNDVTVNNLSTDSGSVYKLNLDFNRGDYLEAKIDLSNIIDTGFQVAFGILDTDSIENYNSTLVLGFIKYDEMSGIYFQISKSTDNEIKTIETTDNIIKFKINEKGIYINDIYANPFDNQDLFNYLLENIKNLNICYLHNIGDISFDYIRIIQQNSDGDEIGHLGKYNHYYQTHTNYPIAIESEDLCYIHDSYLTEIYGQTIQAIGYSVYQYVDGDNYINQPINITNRYQVFNICCNKGNQNDIVYFRVNFTVNECNTEDTNHCGIISTRDGGGYNRLEYKFLKKDVGIRQWKSFTRVIDNTCLNNCLSCLVGLNEELPSGFTSSVDTVVNFTIHDYTCYNLTQLFGSGKEPTKEWCDKNLPYLDVNEIASFNENNNRIKLNISSCPVKFGGDK